MIFLAVRDLFCNFVNVINKDYMNAWERIIYNNKNYMKKALLSLAIICLPLSAFAQTEQTEGKQNYIYNIVTFDGSLNNEGFRVDLDNGKEIQKLRDKNGNKMKFKTPAAALMYFISEGWELFINGATNSTYKGTGYSSTYWIIRKPCSKEEFDKAVEGGIRK